MAPRKVRRPKRLGAVECPRCKRMTPYEQMQYRRQIDDKSRAIICDDCAERRAGLRL